MKRFRVVVNGTAYDVEVEELQEEAGGPFGPEPSPAAGNSAAEKVSEVADSEKEPAPTASPPAPSQTAPVLRETAAEGIGVKAPMPGTILDIKVSVGDSLEAGEVLMVLEAMKMENEITAPQGGSVREILVNKGAAVNAEDVLAVLG